MHLIKSAFARTRSLGSFVLVLRVQTCLIPPVLTLFRYSLGTVCSLQDGRQTLFFGSADYEAFAEGREGSVVDRPDADYSGTV